MTKEEQAKLKDTSMHLLAQVSTCTLYLLDKYQRYHNCSPLTTFSSLPSQKKQFHVFGEQNNYIVNGYIIIINIILNIY